MQNKSQRDIQSSLARYGSLIKVSVRELNPSSEVQETGGKLGSSSGGLLKDPKLFKAFKGIKSLVRESSQGRLKKF